MTIPQTRHLNTDLLRPMMQHALGGIDSAFATQQAEGEAFRADCVVGAEGGTFEAESLGAIDDAGSIAGDLMPLSRGLQLPKTWRGIRVLRGEKGLMVLHIESQVVAGDPRAGEGRFTVVGGNGTYAALCGQGYYSVKVEGDGVIREFFGGLMIANGARA